MDPYPGVSSKGLCEPHKPYGIYDKLHESSRSIRIGTFPSHRDDTVRVTLETVDLDQEPYYEALSYVWGDRQQTKDIEVNGVMVPVTLSLEAALRQFREEESVTFQSRREISQPGPPPRRLRFWADAICINQADYGERDRQVAMMRSIYQKACRVRAWLGTMSLTTADAAQRLVRQATSYDGYRPYSDDLPEEDRVQRTWTELSSLLRPGETSDQFMEALRPFQEAAYWKRKWIVQELVHAERIRFYVGKRSFNLREDVYLFLSWHNLQNFLADALDFGWGERQDAVSSSVFSGLTMTIGNIFLAGICTGWPPALPRKNLLGVNVNFIEASRRLEVSQPLDNVFSVLGCLCEEFSIAPNYRISANEMFTRFTAQIINVSASLQILDQAMSATPGLPSWVPDLSKAFPIMHSSSDYHPSAMDSLHKWRIDRRSLTLTVPGIKVDSVLCAPVLPDTQLMTTRKMIKTVYSHWNSAYQESFGTQEHLADCEAFWRAIDYEEVRLVSEDFREMAILLKAAISNTDELDHDEVTDTVGRCFKNFCKGSILIFTPTIGVTFAAKDLGLPQAGDELFILSSAKSVFYLRPVPDVSEKTYRLINHCGVPGMMKGEFVRDRAKGLGVTIPDAFEDIDLI